MKNNKFSLAEKKLFRIVIVLALIQLVIIFTFVHVLIDSQQINETDTERIDIIVDDIYYYRVPTENRLVIISDSVKYFFKSRSTLEEASVDQLYKSISEGTRLSLRYQETRIWGRTVNLVVDARSETEVFRTIGEYNRGKQGISVYVCFVFSAIEIVFIGIVFACVWINYGTFKGFYRKIKNCYFRNKC